VKMKETTADDDPTGGGAFEPESIESIDAFNRIPQETCGNGWVFRGHADCGRGLRSELEQAVVRYGPEHIPKTADIEKRLIREFARRAYLHLESESELPHPADTLEWLSLMRHHNAPTRLMDWTYSIFVAAHFALETVSVDRKGEWGRSYIWAINAGELDELARKQVGTLKLPGESERKTGKHFRDNFMGEKPNEPFVATQTPYRLNARLAIQQGTFLCPGNVAETFLQNLRSTLKRAKGDRRKVALVFELATNDQGFRNELRVLLHRMNVNTEVLFPGLEGLARALRDRLPHLAELPFEKEPDISWLGRADFRE
jgi:FRG domain